MRKRTIALLLMATIALATVAVLGVASAETDPDCSTATVLNPTGPRGSNFEIDTGTGGANLKVDDADCIDWLSGGTGTSFRSGVEAKNDTASGAGDESFGQGTAEDNENPTIVDGSIPPNKSDLKAFGVFEENDEFLELFWSRVQSPQGTTNMDFELNKNFCDPANPTNATCANNGPNNNPTATRLTPNRETGDKLITYDLSKGGTVPAISIRTWDDTAHEWGPATSLSGGANPEAVGSVNTALIPATETGGVSGGLTTALGAQDPFTFGEAAISFQALFGTGACGTFGSAYLKSRSSDSFTSEIKDFVPPEQVDIGNCPTSLTTDATDTATLPTGTISDQATLGSSVPNGADGEVVFKLYKFALNDTITATSCTSTNQVMTYATDGTSNVTVTNHNETGGTSNPYTSASFTPTEVGKYQWTAEFVPTAGQGLDPSGEFGCGQTVEQSIVNKAPSTINTTQSWLPSDSATVSQTGGTVMFTLLKNVSETDCITPPAGGYGAAQIYTSGALSVPANSPFTVSTTSAATQPPAVTSTALAGDQYRWKVEYSGTSAFNAVTTCKEVTSITINNGDPVTQ